jgi:hypothetical protein
MRRESRLLPPLRTSERALNPRLSRPSPALVISLVALFVALGGTTYAAVSLPRNSVGTVQLKNGAVTKQKISQRTLRALRGPVGRRGPRGPRGPKGDPTYERTIVVSPVGTDTQNGTALLAVVASVTPSEASPYLLKIEPGRYDLGSQTLRLKPFLDVEGSGWVTDVTRTGRYTLKASTVTVQGADGATLRDLQVTNYVTSDMGTSTAISAPGVGGLRLQGVKAVATNAGGLGQAVALGIAGGDTTVVDSELAAQGSSSVGAVDDGLLRLTRSRVDGGDGFGVSVGGTGNSAIITWSDVRGKTNSVLAEANGSMTVLLSILDGPAANLGSVPLTCGGDINEVDGSSLGPTCT